MQTIGEPRAAARRARPLLRRDREPAQDPRRAADPARRRGPPLPGGGPRAHARGPRRGRPRRRRRTGSCATGSSTRCCSPTSTSTTRRCCSCCSWSTATSRVAPRPQPARQRADGPGDGRGRGRRIRDRRRRARASPTTTSGRGTRSRSPPSRSIARRSPTAPTSSSSRTTGTEPPLYWERDGDGGWVRRRWVGRSRSIRAPRPPRLLARGRRLRPLGRQTAADRAGVGGGPRPRSTGIGDAWEWTSSDFVAYPGFEAFPYREYSEVFFGDEHKVLRDGSWATRPRSPRPSFRNWDLPQRRQIFAGFRCARDAEDDAGRDRRPDRDRGPPTTATAAPRWRATCAPACARAEGAGAEVLLRRARLAALRADHRAARVLPDPGRARDPRHPLGRDPRRRRLPADADRARFRAQRRRPATCSTAMGEAGCLETFVPVDISEEITRETAASLVEDYPGLDGARPRLRLRAGPRADPGRPSGGRLVAFLGGTIGNLYPDHAPRLPLPDRGAARARTTGSCSAPTWSRTPRRLEPAYDDSGGVTAEFNKNVLAPQPRARRRLRP